MLGTIVDPLETGDPGSKLLQMDLMDLIEEHCDENESIIPTVLVPSVESVKYSSSVDDRFKGENF